MTEQQFWGREMPSMAVKSSPEHLAAIALLICQASPVTQASIEDALRRLRNAAERAARLAAEDASAQPAGGG